MDQAATSQLREMVLPNGSSEGQLMVPDSGKTVFPGTGGSL